MSESELTTFFLQLAILALLARVGGEIAHRVKLPAVAGEIMVGVLLGPTVLRQFCPDLQLRLFPPVGPNHVALAAIATFGISLFLLVAGMEVDLKIISQKARVAFCVSLGGVVLPFLLGFVPALFWPELFGVHPSTHPVIFALFVGAALSITSLPILAKTLIDLGIYRTAFGMLVISSAVLDDIFGWTLAGMVFSLSALHDKGNFTFMPIIIQIGTTLAFLTFMLTIGRWLCDRLLLLVYQYCAKPSAAIGFVIGTAALGASLTQSIGMHGFFGAFILGVAFGGSENLRKETRESIDGVVSNFMAPIYFASVGLAVNFITNFSWQTVGMILLAACVGKLVGCYSAARLCGISGKSSLAIGIAMNSRGSIEIVLGMMALQAQIINESMLVALAIMALVTSCSSGYFLNFFVKNAGNEELFERSSEQPIESPKEC